MRRGESRGISSNMEKFRVALVEAVDIWQLGILIPLMVFAETPHNRIIFLLSSLEGRINAVLKD
jgi:hypothetical protein